MSLRINEQVMKMALRQRPEAVREHRACPKTMNWTVIEEKVSSLGTRWEHVMNLCKGLFKDGDVCVFGDNDNNKRGKGSVGKPWEKCFHDAVFALSHFHYYKKTDFGP